MELGPHLAERARANLAAFPQVSVVTATFESWDPGSARFDGVFACNSFHWIDPDIRFAKAAAVLRRAGMSSSSRLRGWFPRQPTGFGGTCRTIGQPLTRASTRRRCIRTSSAMILSLAVRASGVFDEPTITRRLFEVTFSADGYATNLSTQSGVKELPANARAELVARIHQRVEDQGGHLTAYLLAVLTIARRAGNQLPSPHT